MFTYESLKFKGIIEELTFEIAGMIVFWQNKIAGMIEKEHDVKDLLLYGLKAAA